MEITVSIFVLLFFLALISETIDASMGMLYGTFLSPLLIILGFDPLVVVPALLLSQAIGGFIASIFHYRLNNVSFKRGSQDLKIVYIIGILGILATIIAAAFAFSIPKIYLKTYIGTLVMIMGFILLYGKKFQFSWKKIFGIGIISAFNKGISGGGFGPIVTSGQIISGQKYSNAVGVTTLAEAPICIAGFLTYLIGHFLLATTGLDWKLIIALVLGAAIAAPFGALITRKVKKWPVNRPLGILVLILGIWTLVKVIC